MKNKLQISLFSHQLFNLLPCVKMVDYLSFILSVFRRVTASCAPAWRFALSRWTMGSYANSRLDWRSCDLVPFLVPPRWRCPVLALGRRHTIDSNPSCWLASHRKIIAILYDARLNQTLPLCRHRLNTTHINVGGVTLQVFYYRIVF